MLKVSNNDEQAKINNLPRHEQVRLMVAKLAANKQRAFNPIKAGSVSFSSIDANIMALIERISEYARKIQTGEGLLPRDCFSEAKQVTLDQFFTDSEGMYIPLDTLRVFTLACDYLYLAIDERGAKRDNDLAVSIRLMGKCFTSMHNFCTAVEIAGKQ